MAWLVRLLWLRSEDPVDEQPVSSVVDGFADTWSGPYRELIGAGRWRDR